MPNRTYGLFISPVLSRDLVFSPTEKVKGQFTFTDADFDSNQTEQAYVATVKFSFQNNGQNIIYNSVPNELSNYSMNSWIDLETKNFTLKKGESITIPYTINVPESPMPGGKYAAIVIQKVQNDSNSQGGASAKLQDNIAFHILGAVKGDVIRSADLVDFRVNKNIFWKWPLDKAEFTMTFKNSGNVDYLPNGDVFLHSGDITDSIWSKQFNQNSLIILPQNSKTYTFDWKPEGGLLKKTANGLTINLDYFRFGKYIATAKVGIEQNNQRIVADRLVSFYVIPLPLFLAILFIIMGSITFNFVKRKTKKHSK